MVDLNIPVGVSDFEKLRENNYYYIDKTGFISKLLQTKSAEVTLITRPRRFGKTLGMRMLASFFDIRKDSRTIFEGLEISKNTALCDEWMNQYPTLFLSFKDVDGLTFSSACDMLMYTISDLYQQHLYLLESDSVNDYDKEIIHHIAERKATVSEIKQSLVLLTKALASYYAKPVILLLDEYDVPIAKASSNGYYDQMLEIIKAVTNNAQVIIMDEPTSSITDREVEKLFRKIEELKAQGISIIYISHKMEEVFRIADDITVLRDGAVVSTDRAEDLDLDTVIARMVGRKLDNVYPKETVPIGDKALEIKDFSQKDLFEDINFHVAKGEIVGFAGLVGAGRTETMRAIFGLDPHDSGQVFINGKEAKIKCPHDSIQQKMVMLSESRRDDGIIPVRSVMENASLASLERIIYKGYTHKAKEKQSVKESFEKMHVKTPTLDTAISTLSGGNQQKVLLARWLLCEPDIMILDEPTRGIDVGAKFEIYKLITDIVKEGKAVIMVSSELPELIGMCDRIYIMCQGKISGCINREEFSQEVIMRYATGLKNG